MKVIIFSRKAKLGHKLIEIIRAIKFPPKLYFINSKYKNFEKYVKYCTTAKIKEKNDLNVFRAKKNFHKSLRMIKFESFISLGHIKRGSFCFQNLEFIFHRQHFTQTASFGYKLFKGANKLQDINGIKLSPALVKKVIFTKTLANLKLDFRSYNHKLIKTMESLGSGILNRNINVNLKFNDTIINHEKILLPSILSKLKSFSGQGDQNFIDFINKNNNSFQTLESLKLDLIDDLERIDFTPFVNLINLNLNTRGLYLMDVFGTLNIEKLKTIKLTILEFEKFPLNVPYCFDELEEFDLEMVQSTVRCAQIANFFNYWISLMPETLVSLRLNDEHLLITKAPNEERPIIPINLEYIRFLDIHIRSGSVRLGKKSLSSIEMYKNTQITKDSKLKGDFFNLKELYLKSPLDFQDCFDELENCIQNLFQLEKLYLTFKTRFTVECLKKLIYSINYGLNLKKIDINAMRAELDAGLEKYEQLLSLVDHTNFYLTKFFISLKNRRYEKLGNKFVNHEFNRINNAKK